MHNNMWFSILIASGVFILGVFGAIVALFILFKKGISVDIRLEQDIIHLPDGKSEKVYKTRVCPKQAGKETASGRYDERGRLHKNPLWTGEPCRITDRDEILISDQVKKEAEIEADQKELDEEREYERTLNSKAAKAKVQKR